MIDFDSKLGFGASAVALCAAASAEYAIRQAGLAIKVDQSVVGKSWSEMLGISE